MTLEFKDFELLLGNNFVAMEYFGLIMNRTFLVLLLEDHILGLKVNGLISVEGGADPVTRSITGSMSIKSDLDNPYSYIDQRRLNELKPLDIYGEKIMKLDKANFRVPYRTLKRVAYNPKKKWGMGHYPHDGKVNIETIASGKKEFIVLGAQSGEKITKWIQAKR